MKKKWLMGSGMFFLVIGGILIGWHFYNETYKPMREPITDEVKLAQFPQAMTAHVPRATLMLNGVNLIELTREERSNKLVSILEAKAERQLTANYEGRLVTTTLGNLGVQFSKDIESILNHLDELENEIQTQSSFEQRLLNVYALTFMPCEEHLNLWTQSVARQLNIPVMEHTLSKTSPGNFNLVEGQNGKQVVTEQFEKDVLEVFQNLTQLTLNVDVQTKITTPVRNMNDLRTVDTRIAVAESHFERAAAGRAANVDRGASLTTSQLLMPGETFSFNNLVYPVIPTNGFHYGTIFMHGELAQGIGGGLCQVSSTIYWAQLRTGILATKRQAHSRPVFYVPRGLDATMYTGLIDYQFINTLDFPLYLNVFTQGGTLTAEFWSSSEALGGRTFEPRTARVETTDTHKFYDTFLRTYMGSQLINESFIHRSRYSYTG